METILTIIAIVGSIASVIGAGIAIKHSRAAKTAAQEAKEARAQIIDHRETSEITKLEYSCNDAQSSMEKYGPGSSPKSIEAKLSGTTPEADADKVQTFMLLVNEHRLIFGSKNQNLADEFVKSIREDLDKFSQSYDSPKQMKEHGTDLLMRINTMSSKIKKILDKKRETLH
jgi:hypothetical protein